MCHYCGHGCGRSSAVPISANGVRIAPWIAQGNGIVVHIFLQIAVARLSKPRFAPFSFRAFHVCHDDDSSAHAVSIRLYNGLHHRRACIDPISIQRHLIRFATHR